MFRFLLDQGFPKPVLRVEDLDKRVAYIHLRDFDAQLSAVSTPDWMVVLSAEAAAFTGIVTRDRSQLNEPETMIALERTSLSVITWSKGIEDPVREWGMLMAYMPQVLKRIGSDGARIITLPNPHIDASHHLQRKHDAARRVADLRKVHYTVMRDEALILMHSHLRGRDRGDLAGPLDRGIVSDQSASVEQPPVNQDRPPTTTPTLLEES